MVGHTRQYVRAAVLSADAGNTANCGAPVLDAGTAANPAAPHEQHPAAPARGRIVKARITGFLDDETLLAELTGEPG